MKTIGAALWVIEYTVAVERPKTAAQGSYTQHVNKTVQLIASDFYRAVELFKQTEPEAFVHVVRRVGRAETVLIDSAFFS